MFFSSYSPKVQSYFPIFNPHVKVRVDLSSLFFVSILYFLLSPKITTFYLAMPRLAESETVDFAGKIINKILTKNNELQEHIVKLDIH